MPVTFILTKYISLANEFSSLVLDRTVERVIRAKRHYEGLHASVQDARLELVEASFELGQTILRQQKFYGAHSLPTVHNVPEEAQEFWGEYITNLATEAQMPYSDHPIGMRLSKEQLVTVKMTDEEFQGWVDAQGYKASLLADPPVRQRSSTAEHEEVVVDQAEPGPSTFPGSMNDNE
jgi:hypothetical protein